LSTIIKYIPLVFHGWRFGIHLCASFFWLSGSDSKSYKQAVFKEIKWIYCLSFHLNFLKTPLVSSNSSYLSRASELNPGFCGVHGAWSLVFCVVFCRNLFLVFFLSIVLSVIRFMVSDNPFGIYKLFLPFKSIWAQPRFLWGSWCLSLVFCVVFCRSLFLGFFVHCIVCSSSIYGFW
jgi:hypothetical protein